ncbi:imelysin family protein [Granulosicoccus antarcticus]|nr:imelysin family protein [Granulosicoccus antarcticus]
MLMQSKQLGAKTLASVAVVLSLTVVASGHDARAAEPDETVFASQAVEAVYQPGFQQFLQASEQFVADAERACQSPSSGSLAELRDGFAATVVAFSAVELYRIGPMLEDNRQNRLFYWPDKRRVGERQLRELLADATAPTLTAADVAGKSVALQGLPTLERLLYSKNSEQHLGAVSDTPDCQVVVAIVDNIHNMALALNEGWQAESALVKSMLLPEPNSDYFRTGDEVLRSLVTQIIVAVDIVLDRKIAALTDEESQLRLAPLWRSGQTLSMIRANLDSVRALSVDTGLAGVGELDNELAFEFRSADKMLQKLQDLPSLSTDQGKLTEPAESLLRSLSAVVGGIKYTLNDRFTAALGITAGFNSEDGD